MHLRPQLEDFVKGNIRSNAVFRRMYIRELDAVVDHASAAADAAKHLTHEIERLARANNINLNDFERDEIYQYLLRKMREGDYSKVVKRIGR